ADGERASHRRREHRARRSVGEESRALPGVIAITGARGYLGAALCHALSRCGHRVRRLTRAPDGARGDAFFSLGEGCSDGALGGASIRPGTVFGVEKGGVFATLDRAVRALPLLPDFGARARLYAVHRDDLIDVVKAWLALDEQSAPRLIPAAHPEPLTLRRMLAAIAAAAGRAPRFIRIPGLPAPAGIRLLEPAGCAVPFRRDGMTSIRPPTPP